MKSYVQDAHANKQINIISSFVENGLSDVEIARKLTDMELKNLAKEGGGWAGSDIEKIRNTFNLNVSEGFEIAKSAEPVKIQKELEVTIINIKMPFDSMVIFMVKWVLASIPAFIILFFLGVFVFAV